MNEKLEKERLWRMRRAAGRQNGKHGGHVRAEKHALLGDRSAEIERLLEKRRQNKDYLWKKR